MTQDLSAFLESLPLSCLMLDEGGGVLAANSHAESLLQRSARSLRSADLGKLFQDPTAIQALLSAARARNAPVSSPELEIANPQAGQIRGAAYVSAAHLAEGEEAAPPRWLLILVHLPDEALGARASALKNRAGSLSAMAAMLAHEIKNPLAAIRGAAQLMTSHNPEMVDLIVAETRRISQLLDTMELFSSPQDLEVGAVNVHAALGEVVSAAQLSFGAHVRFAEDYDPSLPDVRANPHVLHRIFMNLIKNACEACGETSGLVRLKTRFHVAERRRVEGAQETTDLPISVSFIDNGHGIDAAMQDKIFDAFISTKDQGRGLGLAYVAGAVASMDGDLDVTSEPGQTEFQLRLPRA